MTGIARPAFAAPTAADFERRLALITERDRLTGLHALLVSRQGALIFEHYQPGGDDDRARGDLGTTGQTLLDQARRTLFEPMGFGPSAWSTDRSGQPYAASGLRLLPRDMLKLGQLFLSGGNWPGQGQGRQLVPADWMKRVVTPIVRIDANRAYGYHWYSGQVAAAGQSQRQPWIGGFGWGGQLLVVLPDLELVIGINCGNYARSVEEQNRVTRKILVGVVLPLVT